MDTPEVPVNDHDVKAPITEEEWFEQLPAELRTIARRHGRELFLIAHAVGAIRESLILLNRRIKGNNELMRAAFFIENSSNTLANLLLQRSGYTVEQIREVQMDIEQMVALAGANRAAGNIILPS